MGFDVLGNNKFHTRQTHAVIGQEAGLESQFGIADIEHDFRLRAFQAGQVRGFDFKVQDTFINLAVIAFGA